MGIPSLLIFPLILIILNSLTFVLTFVLASQGEALQSWQAQVIETPGHTPGSVCLYFEKIDSYFPKEKILFTGDTLFADGVGRTDLSYSSEEALQNSLKKLARLPKETKIYPGHGESSTLEKTLSFCV